MEADEDWEDVPANDGEAQVEGGEQEQPDEEEGEGAVQGEEEEPVESDFQLAWEMLDLARVIYGRSNQCSVMSFLIWLILDTLFMNNNDVLYRK